ncbi:hypothetical protein [Dankookia sp. P2]|uniref:hypothetical protein n=1 Tax=Dankookia sp. P2 TaxID=3423955 RepID=UPI003D66A701
MPGRVTGGDAGWRCRLGDRAGGDPVPVGPTLEVDGVASATTWAALKQAAA